MPQNVIEQPEKIKSNRKINKKNSKESFWNSFGQVLSNKIKGQHSTNTSLNDILTDILNKTSCCEHEGTSMPKEKSRPHDVPKATRSSIRNTVSTTRKPKPRDEYKVKPTNSHNMLEKSQGKVLTSPTPTTKENNGAQEEQNEHEKTSKSSGYNNFNDTAVRRFLIILLSLQSNGFAFHVKSMC